MQNFLKISVMFLNLLFFQNLVNKLFFNNIGLYMYRLKIKIGFQKTGSYSMHLKNEVLISF